MKNLIAFLLALVVLYFSAVLEKLTLIMRQRTASDFQISPRIWVFVGLEAAFIGAILLLAWAVAFRLQPDRWLGAVWLALGAAVLLYLPLLTSGPEWLVRWLLSDFLQAPRQAIMEGGLHSYIQDASAAIAIVGGWLLFRRRRQENWSALA